MIHIFGRPNCRHCDVAKVAANDAGLIFNYIDLSQDDAVRALFKQTYKTVPQIFYQGHPDEEPRHIGGCQEFLKFLDERSKEL